MKKFFNKKIDNKTQDNNKRLISNIDEIAKNSQKTYVTYLLVLTYIVITVFGITDLNLIKDSFQVSLPIINRNISLEVFFIVSPFLCISIFIFLNLYLIELNRLIKFLFLKNPDYDVNELFPWIIIFSEYPWVGKRNKFIINIERFIIELLRWWLLPIILLLLALKHAKVHDRYLIYLLGVLIIIGIGIALFFWIYSEWNIIKDKIINTKKTYKIFYTFFQYFIVKLIYLMIFIFLIVSLFYFFNAGMEGDRLYFLQFNNKIEKWKNCVPKRVTNVNKFKQNIFDRLENSNRKKIIEIYDEYYSFNKINTKIFNNIINDIDNSNDEIKIQNAYTEIDKNKIMKSLGVEEKINILGILFKTKYYKHEYKIKNIDYYNYSTKKDLFVFLYKKGYLKRVNINLYDKILILISPIINRFERYNVNNILQLRNLNFTKENKNKRLKFWERIEKKHFEGAEFTSSYFSHIYFKNCYFNNATFIDSIIEKTYFENINMQGAFFKNVEIQDISFVNVNMQEANFREAKILEAEFKDSDLQNVDFKYTYLPRVKFINTKMQGAKFQKSHMRSAYFEESNMLNANFYDSKITNAYFLYTTMSGSNFKEAQMQGINFKYSTMFGANFEEAKLQGTNFLLSNIQGANFEGAQMQGCKFKGTYMEGTYFYNTNMQYADFRDAKIGKEDFFKNKEIIKYLSFLKKNNIYSNRCFIERIEKLSKKNTNFNQANLINIIHSKQQFFIQNNIKSYKGKEKWEVFRLKKLYELSINDPNLKMLFDIGLPKYFKNNLSSYEINELNKLGIKILN